MPTRILKIQDNFETLSQWLNENLTDEKRIKACCEQVKNVPETKGIYFWFMHPNGYEALSNHVRIEPVEPKYTRNIDGVKYDLVYLGTAGVRNNSNGINNGHLKERLMWHLCDNKGISALCNDAMSTYRRTIGGLISDDLIANNTQDKIDELLCKYFLIYYVEYPGAFLDVKDEVNSDEAILIDVIRPILNLSKNPNAKKTKHITYAIQQKRQLVESESKKRWCKEKPNTKTKAMNSKPNKPKTSDFISITEENCKIFSVKRDQRVDQEAQSQVNLPVGPCSIELFYENTNDVRLYINGKTRNVKRIGRTVAQYFIAPDTNNGNISKWAIVQNEMNDPEKIIEQITVRVCPIK